MKLDFATIYRNLNFLSEALRLQYSNFIFKHQDNNLSLESIIGRVQKEEPIEYIFNKAEFYNLEFYVDNRVLIPRQETQEIVDKVIEYTKDKKVENIIDIGTGSGCILLSSAFNIKDPDINFIGIDISDKALEVANINKNKLLPQDKRVKFINTKFQDFDFTKYPNTIIASNLPYIPNQDKEILQKSVIDYEPHLALFGGENGHELNNQLLEELKGLENIKVIFMEGLNGKIDTILN